MKKIIKSLVLATCLMSLTTLNSFACGSIGGTARTFSSKLPMGYSPEYLLERAKEFNSTHIKASVQSKTSGCSGLRAWPASSKWVGDKREKIGDDVLITGAYKDMRITNTAYHSKGKGVRLGYQDNDKINTDAKRHTISATVNYH